MRFIAQTECFFGKAKYDDFHSSVRDVFSTRPLALIDGAVADSAVVADVLDRVVASSDLEILKIEVAGEPTYDQLDELTTAVRDVNPSSIIALGGGSVLDLAKGVAALLTNPGTGREYRGFGRVTNASTPVLAIPTTAGTGSEVTWTASFIDDGSRIKLGINGPNVFPRAALLEPRLLIGCPSRVALAAGLDALVHAVEAVSSPMASAPASALAANAVSLIVGSLKEALSTDAEAAWDALQMGAYLAGLAMLNSSGGVTSGVSYPIGTEFHVPHGFAGGIVLPNIIRFNTEHGYKGYEVFNQQPYAHFIDLIEDLYTRLDVPPDFGSWGMVGHQAADSIFEATIEQRRSSLSYNPVTFDLEDLRALLDKLCRVL
jgi:alcohol dehydrogenase class IV